MKLVGGGSALTGARMVLQYGTTTLVTQAGAMISEAAVTLEIGASLAIGVISRLSVLAAPFILDPRAVNKELNPTPDYI